jgi:membrane protease YdiL (CAAX protease family)
MKWSEIKKDRDLLQIYLLMFGLIILVAGFTLINLYFNFVIGIQNEYIISAFWIIAVIPLIWYFLYHKKNGLSFSDIGLKYKGTGKSIIIGLFVGVFLGFISWLFLGLFNSPVEKLPTIFIYWFIFSSVFSAPIREEILTRGLLWASIERVLSRLSRFGKLKFSKKRQEIIVVIIVSLSFWIMHWGRPLEIMFTTLLIDSFVFSLLYLKTRNLMAPITAHAVSNLFIILRTIVF